MAAAKERAGDRGSAIARVLAAGPLHVDFEVDHVDDTLHEGWSVLVHRQARALSDPAELGRAWALGIEPWSGQERKLYVRVGAEALTGRRIRART